VVQSNRGYPDDTFQQHPGFDRVSGKTQKTVWQTIDEETQKSGLDPFGYVVYALKQLQKERGGDVLYPTFLLSEKLLSQYAAVMDTEYQNIRIRWQHCLTVLDRECQALKQTSGFSDMSERKKVQFIIMSDYYGLSDLFRYCQAVATKMDADYIDKLYPKAQLQFDTCPSVYSELIKPQSILENLT
jgi:hypothetical protein